MTFGESKDDDWSKRLDDEPHFYPTKNTIFLLEGASYYLDSDARGETVRKVEGFMKLNPASSLKNEIGRWRCSRDASCCC